jgi:hypothetical protein
MPTTDVARTIRFGVNDTAADAARIRGFNGSAEYKLRLVFAGPGVDFDTCDSLSFEPIFRPRP